jgi:hypothetical protein
MISEVQSVAIAGAHGNLCKIHRELKRNLESVNKTLRRIGAMAIRARNKVIRGVGS